MATTKTEVMGTDSRTVVVSWNLAESESGDPMEAAFYSDRSVQVAGTFDGMTVTIEGSNDGTNYVTLTDPQGNSLSFTSAGIEQIAELTQYLRPSTGADGTNAGDVTITVFAKGTY